MLFKTQDQIQYEKDRQRQIDRDRQAVVDGNVAKIMDEVAAEYDPEKQLWAQNNSRGEKDMQYLVRHGYAKETGKRCSIGKYYELSSRGFRLLVKRLWK